MVDCARHFIPLTYLEAVVDGMAFSKLNVLHLHLSDQESFPMESRRFPELWASAFSDYEVYTVRELRRFVEYARVRGVAVLPEFDTPGHSKSMCRGAPDDACMACSTDNWPLRPLNRTLEYLGDLYEELYGGDDALFPFALAHTGGDEVKYDCWGRTTVVDPDLISYTNFSHGANVSTAARLGHFRCRLLARGVPSGPVNTGWKYADGGTAPGAAGSCMYQ
ncbi:N-acetyl-beta-D-galactosaminidase [Aureococcus anophagefferens]|nr:N-acetyl-beta-D-galactosaminidase [Aureococcus anophagefferens]